MTSTTYRVFAISLRKQRKSKWKKTAWIFQYWLNITPLLFFFLLWAGKDQKLIFGFADLTEITRDWNQFFFINNDIRLRGERKLDNKLHLHLFSLHLNSLDFLSFFFFIYFVIYLSTSEWTGISKPKWGLHSRLCHRRTEIFSNRHATRQAHPGTEEAARSTNCHCPGW